MSSLDQETVELYSKIIARPDYFATIGKTEVTSILVSWEKSLRKNRLLEDTSKSKILITGDIHGDLAQLQKAIDFVDSGKSELLIINGDLVDRGPEMVECAALLMSYSLLNPDKVIYLRGNHELQATNTIYGFRGHITGLFGTDVYDLFSKAFQQLPFALKIRDIHISIAESIFRIQRFDR